MGPRFNGVEDVDVCIRDAFHWAPSMGPRFNGVEDRRASAAVHLHQEPSMGPRFNGVEDFLNQPLYALSRFALQWGHALMAWKTDQIDEVTRREIYLQWGHALMAWKTTSTRRTARPGTTFNGATL